MKHWFITGISRGLGLAIAKAALAQGDRVVGTARGDTAALSQLGDRLTVLTVDMADEAAVSAAVHQAFAVLGRLDVIVNNAGYVLLGAVEHSTNAELRDLFNVDVFAPIGVTRTALPYLRAQGSGHIITITSIAGRAPGAGAALYAAAKAALEGFSAALSQEVAPLGIHVTAVAPGQFRTEVMSARSMRKSGGDTASYDATVGKTINTLESTHQSQLGDPDKAAQVIVKAVYAPNPPLHLLLGSDALTRARDKMDAMTQEIATWQNATLSTDFGPAPTGVSS